MALPAFINWTVHPQIFPDTVIPIRWYGLFFAIAFLLGYQLVTRFFKKENQPAGAVDTLLLIVMVGTVVGARLGHVFFYDWADYKQNPIDILKIWEGGLASHGAAIGILLALWYYSSKKIKRPFLWVVDRVVIAVILGGIFIRLGNLMNHEIIGTPTDVPWAFVFTRSFAQNGIPVHPAQLYEALLYIPIFFFLWWCYEKTSAPRKDGLLFGLFLVLVWSARFFVEFYKHSQGGFESALGDTLSTGQWLSIPLIIAGVILVVWAQFFKPPSAPIPATAKRKR